MKFSKKILNFVSHRFVMSFFLCVFLLIVVNIPVFARSSDFVEQTVRLRDTMSNEMWVCNDGQYITPFKKIVATSEPTGYRWIVEPSDYIYYSFIPVNFSCSLLNGDYFYFKFLEGFGNTGYSDPNYCTLRVMFEFVSPVGEYFYLSKDIQLQHNYDLQGMFFETTMSRDGVLNRVLFQYQYENSKPGLAYAITYNFGDILIRYGNPDSPVAKNNNPVDKSEAERSEQLESDIRDSTTSAIEETTGEIDDVVNDMLLTYARPLAAVAKGFDYLITSDISHPNTKIKSILYMSLGIAVVPLIVGLGINSLRGRDRNNSNERRRK